MLKSFYGICKNTGHERQVCGADERQVSFIPQEYFMPQVFVGARAIKSVKGGRATQTDKFAYTIVITYRYAKGDAL